MEIQNGTVILQQAEADRTCPPNLKWGASQLAAYGLEIIAKSEKLKQLLQCTAILELAGVPFRVEPAREIEGDPPVAEAQVQGEAPGMSDVSEESSL